MISKADIEQLVERKAGRDSPILSIYLDTDQSKASNLKRGFEVELKNILRPIKTSLDKEQLELFAPDAERVRRFVSELEPAGKGLVAFCDVSENFFWTREIKVPLRNNARWSEMAYLRPLLELNDEYERYGVVLVDREHARLFSVFMGDIEEHHEVFAVADVRNLNTTGTDHMLSQAKFQHKADLHVRWHLKNVAETLEKMVERYGFDRIVLGGPIEATSELLRLLSKPLSNRLVGRFALPVKAGEQEVLAETLKIEGQVERQNEKDFVEKLVTRDVDHHHPVALGLESTLLALTEGRIMRLIYADGFRPKGGQCTKCGMLFARTDGSCDYCVGTIVPIDDLVERIEERVVESDVKLEEVAGDAATRLQQVGGIGAILRF